MADDAPSESAGRPRDRGEFEHTASTLTDEGPRARQVLLGIDTPAATGALLGRHARPRSGTGLGVGDDNDSQRGGVRPDHPVGGRRSATAT